MNDRRRSRFAASLLALGLTVALACAPRPAAATEPGPPPAPPSGPLSAQDAVRLAAQHSPTLRSALIEVERAAVLVRGEDKRYTPLFTSQLDYVHSTNPSLHTSGVSSGTNDAVNAQVAINQQFAWGTLVAAELTLGRTSSKYVSPQFPDPTSLGPGYGLELRLSATQPLLRGAGRTLWEAELRSARLVERTARTAAEQAGSEVAQAVLTAWWELWYAEQAVRIQQAAKETAERQVAEAQVKVDAGAMARLAVLPLRSSLATIEEQLLAAETTVRTARITLARLVGGSLAASDLVTGGGEAPAVTALDLPLAQAIDDAMVGAVELTQLRANVEQARLQVAVAEEQAELKLDASAWVSLQGLGNQSVGDAVTQFGEFGAVSGGVSVALELPVNRTTLRSAAAAARLSVDAAAERLRAAEEQVAQQVAELYEQAASAQARIALAERTAAIARETAEGQAISFESGAGTALEVVTAQQDQRQAALRVVRARVDYELARLALLHLTGRLLDRLTAPG